MTQALFRSFDPRATVHIYRRNLPHWRQEGATYFVTFRLADSIPRNVMLAWIHDRQLWMQAHGLAGYTRAAIAREWYDGVSEGERRSFELQEARRLGIELDRCHGSCLLARPEVRGILAAALLQSHGRRYRCGDWVIMPNHVHWIIQPIAPWSLERILQGIKRFSATHARRYRASASPLWQKGSYDRIVRDHEELASFRKYIEQNPLKAGLQASLYSLHRADWLDA